jgi:HK97 family phage prohead protease
LVKINTEVKTMKKEYRDIEVRTLEGEEYIVEGYPITYDTYAEMGQFVETIQRGAASENIENDDVYVVFNHNMNEPLARKKNGTLTLTEDENGVKMKADFSKTKRAREVYEEIKSGLIDKMSFAFTVRDDGVEWEKREGVLTRVIKKFEKLYEVSPVLFPAYEATELYARSIEEVLDTIPDELSTDDKQDTSTEVEEPKTDDVELLKYKYRLFNKEDKNNG